MGERTINWQSAQRAAGKSASGSLVDALSYSGPYVPPGVSAPAAAPAASGTTAAAPTTISGLIPDTLIASRRRAANGSADSMAAPAGGKTLLGA